MAVPLEPGDGGSSRWLLAVPTTGGSRLLLLVEATRVDADDGSLTLRGIDAACGAYASRPVKQTDRTTGVVVHQAFLRLAVELLCGGAAQGGGAASTSATAEPPRSSVTLQSSLEAGGGYTLQLHKRTGPANVQLCNLRLDPVRAQARDGVVHALLTAGYEAAHRGYVRTIEDAAELSRLRAELADAAAFIKAARADRERAEVRAAPRAG